MMDRNFGIHNKILEKLIMGTLCFLTMLFTPIRHFLSTHSTRKCWVKSDKPINQLPNKRMHIFTKLPNVMQLGTLLNFLYNKISQDSTPGAQCVCSNKS